MPPGNMPFTNKSISFVKLLIKILKTPGPRVSLSTITVVLSQNSLGSFSIYCESSFLHLISENIKNYSVKALSEIQIPLLAAFENSVMFSTYDWALKQGGPSLKNTSTQCFEGKTHFNFLTLVFHTGQALDKQVLHEINEAYQRIIKK